MMYAYVYTCTYMHSLKYTPFDRKGPAKIVELNKTHALCTWVRFAKASDEWVEFKHIVSASVCGYIYSI